MYEDDVRAAEGSFRLAAYQTGHTFGSFEQRTLLRESVARCPCGALAVRAGIQVTVAMPTTACPVDRRRRWPAVAAGDPVLLLAGAPHAGEVAWVESVLDDRVLVAVKRPGFTIGFAVHPEGIRPVR